MNNPTTYTLYQQRVFEEKYVLDERLTKLEAFFENPIYNKLDCSERKRLQLQASFMRAYSDVLGERITAFN